MIKGFEEIATKISDNEKKIYLPLVVEVLSHRVGHEKMATNKMIREYLHLEDSVLITETKMRKIISYIRQNHLVPCLIATSRGYYVAEEREEMVDYIKSLHGRIDAIYAALKSLEEDLEKYFKENKNI